MMHHIITTMHGRRPWSVTVTVTVTVTVVTVVTVVTAV
jgi:hypothetical protein